MKKTIITIILLTHNHYCASSAPAPMEIVATTQQVASSDKIIACIAWDIKSHYDLRTREPESPYFQNIKKHLDQNPTCINYCDAAGNTLLMYSTNYYSASMHRLISSYKPNVNAQNKQKQTALHIAALAGNYPAFKELMNMNPDVSLTDAYGHTVHKIILNNTIYCDHSLKNTPFHSEDYMELIHSKNILQRMNNLLTQPPVPPKTEPELLFAQYTIKLMHCIKKNPSGLIRSVLLTYPHCINLIEPICDGNTAFMYGAQSPDAAFRDLCYQCNPVINAQNKLLYILPCSMHLLKLSKSWSTIKLIKQ